MCLLAPAVAAACAGGEPSTTPGSGAGPTVTSSTIGPNAAPATTAPSTSRVPTTAPSSTRPGGDPPTAADVDRARAALASIPVEREHRGGYDRDAFGYPADLDGDGCDTRDEVLRRDSLTPAQVDPSGCAVLAGDWVSVYDGVATDDPSDLEIDHVVALKEAWDSGAWSWPAERLVAFANDVDDSRTLRAVTVTSNRSKGDRDPSNWMPPAAGDWCRYAVDWVAIKARWDLAADQSEHGRVGNVLDDRC